ncbi:hypothetical protein EJB05_23169 [Eragrostis curvula]|uniref:Uncharacterized protein n=1 Tax=Eragrostis curvula TaxID=38414 RepID=A0A5J9V5K0_9POAL|nr:hypothetical protein EJB05_23169 [Eragrostis curvula]
MILVQPRNPYGKDLPYLLGILTHAIWRPVEATKAQEKNIGNVPMIRLAEPAIGYGSAARPGDDDDGDGDDGMGWIAGKATSEWMLVL